MRTELEERFDQTVGAPELGLMVEALLASGLIEDYRSERIIQSVQMAPAFFMRLFLKGMAPIADELRAGYLEVDRNE